MHQKDWMRAIKKAHEAAAAAVSAEAERLLGARPKLHIGPMPPAQAILQEAEKLDADLIVLGTHGRHGVSRLILGSIAEKVIRTSARPVLAVQPDVKIEGFERVLCPVGAGKTSLQALVYAAALAKACGARLTVLESSKNRPPAAWFKTAGLEEVELEKLCHEGDPAENILLACAEHDANLLVMGSRTRASRVGPLFSEVTQHVMRLAPIPLIVVPRLSGTRKP